MQLFLLLMQLIPMILEIVKGIERSSEGKTKIGAEKSALALEAIQVCFEASGDLPKKVSWAKLLPTIANIINAFVAFANRTGLFPQQPSDPTPDGQ
jgi:hypothetical protein